MDEVTRGLPYVTLTLLTEPELGEDGQVHTTVAVESDPRLSRENILRILRLTADTMEEDTAYMEGRDDDGHD